MFCDTDSLFIAGLKTSTVQGIIDVFETRNPYDPTHVSGSILEIEKIKYEPGTSESRTL